MSDSDSLEQPQQPFEVEIIVPRQIELIDPAQDRRWQQPPVRRMPFRKRKKLALFLFLATCLSTLFAGVFFHAPWTGNTVWGILGSALTYAVPVMTILLAHEMGHYLMARRYRVPASYPYFIPMPISPFGTMGAVIVQGAGVANRKQLFDIAIWGPLSGLIFAIPVVIYGISTSEIHTVDPTKSTQVFGDPLILQWLIEIILRPLKENEAVFGSPIFFAGWVGIFITALNLIPIGQLDGGHILYTLIGKRAHIVAKLILLGAVAYALIAQYFAYILMILLLLMMGPSHPPTADDHVPLGWPRVVLGWLTLCFIIIGFTPQPIVETQPQPQQQKKKLENPSKDQLIATLQPRSTRIHKNSEHHCFDEKSSEFLEIPRHFQTLREKTGLLPLVDDGNDLQDDCGADECAAGS